LRYGIRGRGSGKGNVDKMDMRDIPFFRIILDRVYCPECKTRMERVNSPYEIHWRCPKCNWITWYSYKK